MLTEKEIRDYYDQENALEEQIEKKKEEKQALYEANKEKVDLKDKLQKKVNNFKSLAIVFGLLTLTIFVGNILAIASPLVAILFVLLRRKPKKQLAILLEELKEYDSNVAVIDSDIEQINGKLEGVRNITSRHYTEKKYSQYANNHICIYVGESTSPGLESEPCAIADYYSLAKNVNVYIDGVEWGGVEKPFSAFEVSPGMHTVKIECYTYFAGRYRYDVMSKVERVNVSKGSVYLFYHWNFYSKNGIHHNLYLKTFDNIHDFLDYTHQY